MQFSIDSSSSYGLFKSQDHKSSGGDKMAKKPTTADAHLIIELYDLRREPEMRKARS